MKSETKWSVDQAHSEITFKVRHLMIAHVKGAFKTFDANIYTTGTDFTTAQIDVWIDASSVNTGDEKRDEHLKGADFFDAQKHKQITFTATRIEKGDEAGNHALWGELTMLGFSKNIKLNIVFGGIAKDPWGNEKAGFEVTGKIDRSDWGLVWNTTMDSGGFMVSNEISISCEIELIKTSQGDLVKEVTSSTNEKA